MSTRFSIDATFKALDKFSGPVAKMTTRMDRFSRAARRGLGGIMRNTKRMVRGMRSAALTIGSLTVAAGFGLKGLLGPAVQFEQAVAGINAVTRNRIKEEGNLNKVRQRALDLGGSTIYTTIQVANAMESLARAGLKTNEILGGIQPILHAAGAEGAAIEDVSKVVISTMKAFHQEMNLQNTTKAADLFAAVSSSAKTNIIGLAEGVSKFAPVAKAFNFSMNDTIATVAALQDLGIEESMSGTQLKTMFSKLTTMAPKAKKQFKDLGIEVFKANGDLKQIPDVLQEIAAGLKRAGGTGKQVEALTRALGLRGSLAGLLLAMSMGKKSGGVGDLLEIANKKYAGAAEQIYGLRQQTTAGAFRELRSAWETFRIRVGKGQLPNLQAAAESLTDALRNPANVEKFSGYLDDAVKNLKDFWTINKDMITGVSKTGWAGFKVAFKGLWGLLKLLDGVIRLIMWPLGKLWDISKVIASKMPDFNTAFNQFMAGFAPDTGEGYRNVAHMGAPYAPSEVSGVITVEARPGTTAAVSQHDKGQITFDIPASGDWVGAGP